VTDTRLLFDIERAEGCRLVGYPDGGGVPTVGYGHTGPEVYVGMTITQTQAISMLSADIDEAAAQAQTLPEWSALDTDCRRNALIECIFNLGEGHWKAEFPKTRAAIQAQDWSAAYSNLLNSPQWVRQVGAGRVNRLAMYFRDGWYPAST
jgi:GH24 family phage-related lysozyme (muramidase)